MLLMLLIALAPASPRNFKCITELDAFSVYPAPGAKEVPTNSSLSILRKPAALCGVDAERWDVELLDESGGLTFVSDVLAGDATIARFPLTLQPHTAYGARLIAVGWGPDGGDEVWRWSFTTGGEAAAQPRAVVLSDVHGLFQRVQGDVEVFPRAEWNTPDPDDGFMSLEVQYGDRTLIGAFYNTDETALLEPVREGQNELYYGIWDPLVERTAIEPSKPSELCLTATYVNAAGDAGPQESACGPLESFGCSSVGPQPTSLAALLLLFLVARRRQDSS